MAPVLAKCALAIKRRIRRMVPDRLALIRLHMKAHGAVPNIVRPATFSEKVLCRNLFDRRVLLSQMADKAAARSYVASRLGPQILPDLYHLTSDPATIPFDRLPEKFVVKPTHGSGWVRLVTDKSAADRAALVRTCSEWLGRSYYRESREAVYRGIVPQILVEQFVGEGCAAPIDYKLFVFGGMVEFIQVDVGRFTEHRRRLYTPAWEKLDVRYVYDDFDGELPPPAHLAEMIAAAQALGRGWGFIRVDFYDTAGRLYFGELTLTPEAGRGCFDPKEFDRYLGGLWKHSGR